MWHAVWTLCAGMGALCLLYLLVLLGWLLWLTLSRRQARPQTPRPDTTQSGEGRGSLA